MTVTIAPETQVQTVITTYEMTPGTCSDVIEALSDAFQSVIRHQPGFIGAAIHVNDARTRIAVYSQWRKREDFLAVLRGQDMRERNKAISALCSRFEPVLYEVAATI